MKNTILLIAAVAFFLSAQAQEVITKNGYAKIFSTTVIEDIEAENFKVVSKFNKENGDFIVSVPVQSFKFEKSLMQKHFNQANFMDSQKYPKIKFNGKIDDLSKIDFAKDGDYEVTVSGDLTIRDVTKPISEKGTISVKAGKIKANSVFTVKNIYQYGVGKPQNKKKKDAVAEDIKVTFKAEYDAS